MRIWLIVLHTGVLINWCQELWKVWDFILFQFHKLACHSVTDAGRILGTPEWETKDFMTHSISSGQNISNFLYPFSKAQFSQADINRTRWHLHMQGVCYMRGLLSLQNSRAYGTHFFFFFFYSGQWTCLPCALKGHTISIFQGFSVNKNP